MTVCACTGTVQTQETCLAAGSVKRTDGKNGSSSMIFLDGKAGCRHKMRRSHKKNLDILSDPG